MYRNGEQGGMIMKQIFAWSTGGILFLLMGWLPGPAGAQEIPGTLIFQQTFEEELTDWYLVQHSGATADYFMDEGKEGQGITLIITVPPTVAMNNLQLTFENIERPEGSDLYDWRVTFWIRTRTTPFTIRPIVAMSEDPWTGTSVNIPIETGGEWVYIDTVLPAGDFLTTDILLLIFHMGNPGDEFGENEVSFDEINLYLLDQPAGITGWELL